MKTYVDEIGTDVRYMELEAVANYQAHYSETPLGSVLRQWETADMMKHVPTDWTLPVAVSKTLYDTTVHTTVAESMCWLSPHTFCNNQYRTTGNTWATHLDAYWPSTSPLSAGPTDPCAP